MQVSNDKVKQVMIQVADAQTGTYRWASAATNKINSHTKRIAGMGEEVLVRASQVENMGTIAESLRKILAELATKHPEAAAEGKRMLESDAGFEEAAKLVATSKTAGVSAQNPAPPSGTSSLAFFF